MPTKAAKKTATKTTKAKSASKSTPRKKMTMKAKSASQKPAKLAKKTAPKKSTRSNKEQQADPMTHQSPLESLAEHIPAAEATREMGVSIAAHAPKKEPLPQKIKQQNKTAKNVSHSRSHASQYRG